MNYTRFNFTVFSAVASILLFGLWSTVHVYAQHSSSPAHLPSAATSSSSPPQQTTTIKKPTAITGVTAPKQQQQITTTNNNTVLPIAGAKGTTMAPVSNP